MQSSDPTTSSLCLTTCLSRQFSHLQFSLETLQMLARNAICRWSRAASLSAFAPCRASRVWTRACLLSWLSRLPIRSLPLNSRVGTKSRPMPSVALVATRWPRSLSVPFPSAWMRGIPCSVQRMLSLPPRVWVYGQSLHSSCGPKSPCREVCIARAGKRVAAPLPCLWVT